MAPTFGAKDRTGDRTEITIPPRGSTGNPDLEALILKTVEDALAAGPGTAPVIDNTALVVIQEQAQQISTIQAALAKLPVDVDWTVCPTINLASHDGLISARYRNGEVQLRGNLQPFNGTGAQFSTSNTAYRDVLNLPAGIPKPVRSLTLVASAMLYNNGATAGYRAAIIKITPAGVISVVTTTTEALQRIELDGIGYVA